MATTLEEMKRLALELTADERQKLLEYLKPISKPAAESVQNGDAQSGSKKSLNQLREEIKARRKQMEELGADKIIPLEELWRISDELAANEDPNSETMTQEFLRTRR